MRLFRRGERASTLDLLVAGLGNPGREYEQTRHNVGWMVVDEVARRHDGSFRSKFDGQLCEIRLGDLRLALLKPETYMNVSGKSIAAAQPVLQGGARRAPRRARRRRPRARAPAGPERRRAGRPQRAALDRVGALGTQDFLRLRIGVGRPGRGDRRPGRRLRPLRVRAGAGRRRADRPRRGRRGDDRARRRRGGPAALQLTRNRHDRVTPFQTTLKNPGVGGG